MENLEMLDEKNDLSSSSYTLSSSSFKGSEIAGNESVLYEKFLLDDLDSYWDELNDRLTVSRMVSDSVIKGMVHAVVDESEEKIAAKHREIETLQEKLHSYWNYPATGNMAALHYGLSEADGRWNSTEDLCEFKRTAEDQIQKLKEDIQNLKTLKSNGRLNSLSIDVGLCSILSQSFSVEKLVQIHGRVDSLGMVVETLFEEMNKMFHQLKVSMFEQQWKYEFERQVSTIVIERSVSTLQDEFDKKFYEQRNTINMLNMNWQERIRQLSGVREDFDSISRFLSSSEAGSHLSHNSLDSYGEWNNSKRKDYLSSRLSGDHHLYYAAETEENDIILSKQSEDFEKYMLEVTDSTHLKHMSKEELESYYRTEMLKMRRQHDSALQEKTEEIFKLKREFLRQMGSSHFKKDKEFELLKKKIPEVILKLEGILLDKGEFAKFQSDHEEISSLKRSIDTLLSENRHLRDSLSEKRIEVKNLSSHVSNAARQMSLHSSMEAKLLQHIKKLHGDLEDIKIEATIRGELHKIIFKEVIAENKCAMENIEIETRFLHDIYTTAVRGSITDGVSAINSIMSKYVFENSYLKALLGVKDRELSSEFKEKKLLKETITSLSALVKEKEHDASETGSTVMQQKQQCDLLNREIDMLREQIAKQEELISNSKKESDMIKRSLEEALKQIDESEKEIKILNGNFLTTSNALVEAEKQKDMFHGIIEDREKHHTKNMESIVKSMMALSRASTDFENKLTEKIERNEKRLCFLSMRLAPIMQEDKMLATKVLLYKQILEIRSSNLQKAEAEVDLLGDEVDALLSLLGKIYIALDHYSPVLQHYPGVMEILKLVQRELEGEPARSV